MCDCDNNKNVVVLPHINIYTTMAEYKAKYKDSATFFKGVRVTWNSATQEELAWVYEEVDNGSHYVEKINKTSSNEKSITKVSKKSSNNKKDTKEK
tara:strand:- start:7872 stop:8159 length:288 start_codon:yes stop_codon:yes gene_type:complete